MATKARYTKGPAPSQLKWAATTGSGDEKVAAKTMTAKPRNSNFGGTPDADLHHSGTKNYKLFSAVHEAVKKAAKRTREAQAVPGKRVNHSALVQQLLIEEYRSMPDGNMVANDSEAAAELARQFIMAARNEGIELPYEFALKLAKGKCADALPQDTKQLQQYAKKRYAKCSPKTRSADASKLAIREVNRLRAAGQHADFNSIFRTLMTA
jgi:hypothetical protein